MKIDEISKNSNTFVIAEVAGAHEGSIEKIKDMIRIASDSKVDAIKFQIFKTDKLVVKNHPKYDSFKKKEFSKKEWLNLIGYAKKLNLAVMADIFDRESLIISEEGGVDGYKVHSTILSDISLIEEIAETKKPILISVGGSTYSEIKEVFKIFKKAKNKIFFMIGYQSFPTKIEDSNLNLISYFKKKFNCFVGYADHCDANKEIAMILPLLAIAKGARLIEKHFTVDRSLKGTDYFSALNPDELKEMVRKIRIVEKTFGRSLLDGFSQDEEEYRVKFKKYIVASRKIKKGEKLSMNLLEFKRTTKSGILPKEAKIIINKTVNRDIKEDETIKLEYIQ
jgi:sialic acid synthase SpsE